MLVAQFLMGLKEDLRQSIEMHLPDTISKAATLASVQEHLLEKHKYQPKKYPLQKPDNKAVSTNSDLWKARQLKEYR
jgi:hypothetical protein